MRKEEKAMENVNLGTAMQWIQLVVMVIGLVTLFIQIGNKQGKQEEKNKNFEETLKIQRDEIEIIKNDISAIKSDVAYIKGKLL